MVLYTGGYNVSQNPTRAEPTRIVDGNQLSVEQRFFSPTPAAAGRLVEARHLAGGDRPSPPDRGARPTSTRGNWISTGGSKGGMTSVYHRRFYPGDVDGTVAYVAPNDVVNFEDSAYTRFFRTVGDAACRDALVALQREALGRRRAELLGAPEGRRGGRTAGRSSNTIGTPDRSLELSVLDTAWAFWQYQTAADCPTCRRRPRAPTTSTRSSTRGLASPSTPTRGSSRTSRTTSRPARSSAGRSRASAPSAA